jgi:hypothetical protein
MLEKGFKRKLTAIFSADVEGYSRLMGEDEIGTIRTLTAYHTEKILVRHHLTHTSQGMPGERYKYNGFLFTFLSNVAEKASGKAFDKLLVEKIIAPLGMTRTVPSINDEFRNQTLTQRAKYYRIGTFGGFVPSKSPVRLSTSASMVSTVIDLAKFDVAMDRDMIISKESKLLSEIVYLPCETHTSAEV